MRTRDKSNLQTISNLMLDDVPVGQKHRYLPGDFVAEVYPEKVDSRIIEKELTTRQIIEYKQYIVCVICGKPCAGSCES